MKHITYNVSYEPVCFLNRGHGVGMEWCPAMWHVYVEVLPQWSCTSVRLQQHILWTWRLRSAAMLHAEETVVSQSGATGLIAIATVRLLMLVSLLWLSFCSPPAKHWASNRLLMNMIKIKYIQVVLSTGWFKNLQTAFIIIPKMSMLNI